MALATGNLSFRDFKSQISNVSWRVNKADDAANAAANTSVASALDGISDAAQQTLSRRYATRVSNAPSTIATATRERKLVVRYEDTVTFARGSIEIPAPNMSILVQLTPGDFVSITEPAAMVALVTQLETNTVSPLGNAISVIDAYTVGRDL